MKRFLFENEKNEKSSHSLPSGSSLASGEVAVRLWLAFGLLVVLLIAVGDLGIHRMDRINDDLQNVFGGQWAKLRLSREALTYSNRNSRMTMQTLLLKDRAQIGSLLAVQAENSKTISNLISDLERLSQSAEEKRALAAIEDARSQYLATYGRAIHLLVDDGKRAGAVDLMVQEGTPALLKYHTAWDDYVRFQSEQLELAARRSRARYAEARRDALFMIVIAVVAAAAIALFVTRRIVREITIRLQSQRDALRVRHREAEIFINAVPSILIGVDQDSRITRWNSTAARTFGLSQAEVAGKRLTDCGIKWLRPGMEGEILSWCSARCSRRCDQVSFAMNGEMRLLGLTITPVHLTSENLNELLVIGSDITDREKVEEAFREAERKYRGIFDDAIVGIFQSTPDGRFLSVNPAMARIFGYDSPQEMIASLADISRQMYVDSKRRDELVRILDRFGVVQNFECEVFRKDGSKIWVAASARAIRQNGTVVRYEGMNEDVTERKLLQAQLLQAQKLESVGQLAAGIAHEINTPTQYIGDNVRFLKDAFQDLKSLLGDFQRMLLEAKNSTSLSRATIEEVAAMAEQTDTAYLLEEIPAAIEQTLEGVTRVSKLVSAMKEFSHPGTKEKTPLDLNHAIESTITVARNEWKYVADLETEFDPALPLISCQPSEFNQVILNLIVNAAHAVSDVVARGGSAKGKIQVQTRNCQDWAEIRIGDTGPGIPENVQPRIFDPFFTTKAIGKGTGQGLAIARSVVVDKHNGTIHFETEAGKGTTFIIRLPHDGKALAAQEASA